ncbi:hypothetical protein CONLIGDRAFT_29751 [Coniochaeta ligniaria NRRL 30616]|uniref:Uncharacterized protein n=1 Tax=Coniochaeta ligniaria NRRL 30616 TaxID=1408157 RepID=A0A1J7J458_9PEZI|nr:hypothetical protein CONLIGDRAFT_29751 [Coniochaeta ligniaria NRRL 30616]
MPLDDHDPNEPGSSNLPVDSHPQGLVNAFGQIDLNDHGPANLEVQPVDRSNQSATGNNQPAHLYTARAAIKRPVNRYIARVRGRVNKRRKPEHTWRQIVEAWYDYIGEAKLEDWQRLCRDLTLEGDFKTKQECKEALSTVWVNLVDFLFKPEEVALFGSEGDLRMYTQLTDKVFPKRRIEDMENSPLEALLAYVFKIRPEKTSKKG